MVRGTLHVKMVSKYSSAREPFAPLEFHVTESQRQSPPPPKLACCALLPPSNLERPPLTPISG